MGKEWNAQDLLQISGAYWSSCVLQTAVQLDIFSALADGPMDAAELAHKLDCNERAMRMLLNALVSLEFLERRPDGKVGAESGILKYLSSTSQDYLGFIIKHHSHLMPNWAKLAQAVHTGASTAQRSTLHSPDSSLREAFLMGMFNIARLQAGKIAEALDLSGRSRLIDVGGGPGTYAVYFCRENPGLRATIFDLPTSEPVARKIVESFNLSGRIEFVGGDYISGDLPAGYDVAWLSQVLHGEGPANAAALIRNAAACLEPGGMIGVQEFMLDDDGNGPVHAALFSLNMLVQTRDGQAYTQGEITNMLLEAGAKKVRLLDVRLPSDCKVLIGEM